ncbi:hydantoinase/oxoprolinase N-terminal domain-containing protein [Nakamurella lactea]|uniref:hydantoinase/oxoprolinase N-terminal domain-containing protein n=1 Tax=Nakamurella lactea TaxID=459515 RepID=UPI000423D436|nr:hydantoinase/oxoprolinase family protein [Nakamurella lactea]
MTALRVGLDVGGTNTDAVVVDEAGEVLTWHKSATTPDVLDGIRSALAAVLADVDREAVGQVMLGTTHPVNALIRRRGLARVGILRIAAPATLSISPLSSWPRDLAALVRGQVEIIRGGHEYEGTEISPLDEDATAAFARDCRDRVDAIAVTGVTSPANPDHELRARAIITEILGDDFPVTLGHEVGGLGLLERENSAVLNGALRFVGLEIVHGLESALAAEQLDADIYLTQNDGTLLAAAEAARRPIMTIGSGPTNSMRGAAYLSGLTDAIVMDVGGTSTDVGLLIDSFPRESALAVEIGGVRTNYRMPDLISVGLGGGSILRPVDGTGPAAGPDSVGHEINRHALIFGGGTPTLSDVSVMSGRADFGDIRLAEKVLDAGRVSETISWVDDRIQLLADRIKAAHVDLPLIAVGGGAHLVPDRVEGVSEVVRHRFGGVANAIGAAIAEASGSVDRSMRYDDSSREECLAEASAAAIDAAIHAGADPANTRITTVNEIPMAYMPGNSARVQVKAVGPLLARTTTASK